MVLPFAILAVMKANREKPRETDHGLADLSIALACK